MDFQRRETGTSSDARPRTTGWIWFWATLMMGPSIVFSLFEHSATLPLCLIAGATLSSGLVWAFGGAAGRRDETERRALEEAARETAQLRAHVEDLEARLQSLETIGSYENARRERSERAEQARFGAPHEAALGPDDDPFAIAPPAPRSNYGHQTRDGKVAEG